MQEDERVAGPFVVVVNVRPVDGYVLAAVDELLPLGWHVNVREVGGQCAKRCAPGVLTVTTTTTVIHRAADVHGMNIRPLRSTEIQQVVSELWRPFAEDMEARNEQFELADGAEQAMVSNFSNGLRQDNVFAFVAEVEGEVVAYLLFEIRDAPPIFTRERDCALDQLYVKPEHRGNGIAQALIDRATSIGERKGAETVVLTIDAENESGLEFFENMGYEAWRHHLHKPIE